MLLRFSLFTYGISRNRRYLSISSSFPICLTDEVKNALDCNIPVVALESTIISHGMPYPQNLDVAFKIEQTVRDNGCIPATIAIIDGIPKIGLTRNDLEILAGKNKNINVVKASRRDLSFVCTNKITAGTTVASTMILANMAGIKVFATGGIGGVHRGAEYTFDVSADLYELAKTPVTVVCAGIKSILDIPKTLEVLETNGVPVITYKSDIFPAFFSNNSGCPAVINLSSTKNIAEVINYHHNRLKLQSGIVVGVPNPDPMNSVEIEDTIKNAVELAKIENVTGAKLTPYILAKLEKITHGKSLDANISLVLNNAKIASDIAKELIEIETVSSTTCISNSTKNISFNSTKRAYDFIGFGGAVIDIIGKPYIPLIHKTSNPGFLKFGHGGVARNICEAIARKNKSNKSIGLVSIVANDQFGQDLLKNLEIKGIDTTHVKILNEIKDDRTATYTAVHDSNGALSVSIADMEIFKKIDRNQVERAIKNAHNRSIILLDGNLSVELFQHIINIASLRQCTIVFDTTSDFKCTLPIITSTLNKIHMIKPNLSELIVLMRKCIELQLIIHSSTIEESLNNIRSGANNINDIENVAKSLFSLMIKDCEPNTLKKKHLLVSMGGNGIMWIHHNTSSMGSSSPSRNEENIVSKVIPIRRKLSLSTSSHFNGAGDVFFAGVIHELLLSENITEKIIETGKTQRFIVFIYNFYIIINIII